MLSFLRDLKDPWKLLVTALVVANVLALVAVFLMLQNKNTAKASLREAYTMLQAPARGQSGRKNAIFNEVRKIAGIRALTRDSDLKSTDEGDVRTYIYKWADHANLPTNREVPHSSQRLRKGVREHIWKLLFKDKEPDISREQLAYFLYKIKTLTPQLKIRSINSGPSTDDATKADHWRPEIEFVLTKEEAPEK